MYHLNSTSHTKSVNHYLNFDDLAQERASSVMPQVWSFPVTCPTAYIIRALLCIQTSIQILQNDRVITVHYSFQFLGQWSTCDYRIAASPRDILNPRIDTGWLFSCHWHYGRLMRTRIWLHHFSLLWADVILICVMIIFGMLSNWSGAIHIWILRYRLCTYSTMYFVQKRIFR